MKNHADFFRGQLTAAFGLEPLGSAKLSEWVNSGNATLTAPVPMGYPQTLQSLTSLRPLFGFEAERFSSAALESYVTARNRWSDPEDRDGLAWKFVSLYYSAYYSAHAILRLSGITVTQIENWRSLEAEFNALYKSSQSPALGLENGYHILRLDQSGTSLSIEKARVDSTHGSHAALWHEFKKLADSSYANNFLNTSLHQAAVGAYSQQLSTSLTVDGRTCNWPWMPVVRNRINYRLPEKVWGARSKRLTPSINKRIHNLINSPTCRKIFDSSAEDLEWIRFSASCVYLVCLLCHLIRDMELRSKSRTLLPSFLKERESIISKLCSA